MDHAAAVQRALDEAKEALALAKEAGLTFYDGQTHLVARVYDTTRIRKNG